MALSATDRTRPTTWITLGGILLLFAVMSVIGITWGLPSRKIDKYLFGDGEVWSGEKIYRLAKADAKFSPTRGADVDVDPIRNGGDEPVPLTATEEDVAKIYLRYRLYTYQPDEMITMMALAGMRPSKLDLDPRLYQYGGLFIYPVGALIKLCGILGLIDVRSDVVYYLDHPDEFGKFYIVARAYSAAWGLIGVIIVYAIAKRIALHRAAGFSPRDGATKIPCASAESASPLFEGGSRGVWVRPHRAGLLAALLFTLMPVVVCMAHEGKPHLPGAVLMLLAVYIAMRCLRVRSEKFEVQSSKTVDETTKAVTDNRQSTIDNRQFFWWMCLCCGAALGMVLSSWPIMVLIPLVAFQTMESRGLKPTAQGHGCLGVMVRRVFIGMATALGVYIITNPYVLINVFVNREVLRSNFGNSLAMYQIARIGEGFIRVVELTIEGATPPVVVFGLFALVVAIVRKNSAAVPLIVVATLFFLQFVLIGAGKPAEYARFGLFTNATLIVGAACMLAYRVRSRLAKQAVRLGILVIILWTLFEGGAYLRAFHVDASHAGSRGQLAEFFRDEKILEQCPSVIVGVPQEPAPYCLPPMDFARTRILLAKHQDRLRDLQGDCRYFVAPTELRGLTLSELLQPSRNMLDVIRPRAPISWANKPLILWPIDPVSFGD